MTVVKHCNTYGFSCSTAVILI